jgi:hypothetical protein
MGRKKQTGLVQRGDIWYINATVRGYGRVRESTGTRDYNEAQAYYQHRVRQIREAAIYGIRPRRTFREAAEHYVKTCEKRSLGRDVQDLRIVLPYIGELYLDEVHQGRLLPFIEARRNAGRRAGTINRTLAVVRRILHLAARLWRDEHNLTWLAEAPLIQLVKGAKRPGHPLTLEEQTRLLSALPRHLSEMALFCVHIGARQEEICGLRWAWYRDPRYFALPETHTKSGRSRPLILNSTARAIVEQRRSIHPEYVFTYEGHRILRMLNSAWKRARREVELPERSRCMICGAPQRRACGMRAFPNGR